jgi:hypothetical protein
MAQLKAGPFIDYGAYYYFDLIPHAENGEGLREARQLAAQVNAEYVDFSETRIGIDAFPRREHLIAAEKLFQTTQNEKVKNLCDALKTLLGDSLKYKSLRRISDAPLAKKISEYTALTAPTLQQTSFLAREVHAELFRNRDDTEFRERQMVALMGVQSFLRHQFLEAFRKRISSETELTTVERKELMRAMVMFSQSLFLLDSKEAMIVQTHVTSRNSSAELKELVEIAIQFQTEHLKKLYQDEMTTVSNSETLAKGDSVYQQMLEHSPVSLWKELLKTFR